MSWNLSQGKTANMFKSTAPREKDVVKVMCNSTEKHPSTQVKTHTSKQYKQCWDGIFQILTRWWFHNYCQNVNDTFKMAALLVC